MPAESVKVVVRVRPMNSREKKANCSLCVDVDEKLNQITMKKASDNDVKSFTFDYVFGIEAFQQNIYENTAFPLVESVVEGYNGTICAYGQTGCGKTFTMIGDPTSDVSKGIIPRTFEHIINMINTADQANKKFLVRCSYLEIYNEDIHDLLAKDVKQKMDIKESPDKGVFVKDLSIIAVRSVAEMDKYMTLGTNSRAVGATAMNEGSSRSHCIFTVYIECSVTDAKGNAKITAGKLNLVDLAGSERQDKTQATGDRLKEATKINLSLSALGSVISALVAGKAQHIPYRDSKLTRLLQDSLGGNTKTIIIAAVSPADESFEETTSTLRYAARAKLIKNQPKVNEDPKDAQLKEYADEIKKLRDLLSKQQQGGSIPNGIGQQDQQQQQNQQQNQQQQQMTTSTKENKGKVEEMEKKLQNVNQDLQKQKDKYESDLKVKEESMQKEREEREKLLKLIQEKEQVLMSGGQANDEEKKKYKQIQGKIKQHKKDHEKLVEERKQQDGEMLKMEKNYNSLNDEVEQLRKLVTYLRKKYQESLSEIKDLEKENEYNKSDLLDEVRIQDKELKLLNGIMKMLLSKDEIEVLRGASEWNDDQKDYRIPLFVLKQKKLNFPKLPGAQAMDLIEQEKEARILTFNESDSEMRESFRLRAHNNYSSPQVPKKGSEKQSLRNDSVPMMNVNSALSGSNCSLPNPGDKSYPNNYPTQLEKRQTNVQLQPLHDGSHQHYQLPKSPQSYQYSDNSSFSEQQNHSNVPSQQKPNKANVQLQPMEKPPMIPRDHLGDLNQPQSDFKRPGRAGKLNKIN